MSQAKVDRYKEEKANRKKILAKEKRKRIAGTICGWLIALLIVGWAGYSGYNAFLILDNTQFSNLSFFDFKLC